MSAFRRDTRLDLGGRGFGPAAADRLRVHTAGLPGTSRGGGPEASADGRFASGRMGGPGRAVDPCGAQASQQKTVPQDDHPALDPLTKALSVLGKGPGQPMK
ncbi:hypothetical protein GCM10009551_064150 [Nocardiopsis tropica]